MSTGKGKRLLSRMAVAALVVAGVLGAVGTAVAEKITDGTSYKSAATTISVGFDLEGEIDFIAKPFDVKDLAFDVTKYKQVDPGNLGLVKIKTNAGRWDVSFKTAHGGKLFAPANPNGPKKCKDDWVPTLAKPGCENDSVLINSSGQYLLYKTRASEPDFASDNARARSGTATTDKDYVQLSMSIGAAGYMAASPGYTGYVGYYSLGAEQSPPAEVKPTLIGKEKMSKSATDENDVSFAKSFGAAAADATAAQSLVKLLESRPDWKADFMANYSPSALDAGFPMPQEDPGVEYFYVNVGLGEANYKDIQRVADKTFSETITFSLVVNW